MQFSKLHSSLAPTVLQPHQPGFPARCQGIVRPIEVAETQTNGSIQRRAVLLAAGAGVLAAAVPASAASAQAVNAAPDFVQTKTGLLIQDITVGQGRTPQPGDRVVVHWAGRDLTQGWARRLLRASSSPPCSSPNCSQIHCLLCRQNKKLPGKADRQHVAQVLVANASRHSCGTPGCMPERGAPISRDDKTW
jgi:hypothetical protein